MTIHILHVEDDPDIREIAKISFELSGEFIFTQFASGEEALIVVQNIVPDLLLLDVMMPGMDGRQTLKQMREMTHIKEVPVIFLTARVQPSEEKELLDLGAEKVIIKPFDPLTLSSEVLSVLNQAV